MLRNLRGVHDSVLGRIRWYFAVRLPAKWRLFRNTGNALNRRVTVENYLLDAAIGRKPLPDADKCRELAYKLGTPGRYTK